MKGLLFIYGMAYGGAVVSLLCSILGSLIYAAFGNLEPDWPWFWSVAPRNYGRIIPFCVESSR